jgi:trk system potassium uptake protein TrkH
MGMVVFMVAIMPLIGAGGFQLFIAESSGPETEKIAPRISSTARILWFIYIALTILQTLLLILSGLNWFEALNIAFCTISTGGFGTKNASITAFNSPWVEWICIVFMAVAGFNFYLIFRLIQGKIKEITKNTEARTYGLIIFLTGILCAYLLFPNIHITGVSQARAFEQSIRKALFQCISILTTTGFSATDHMFWHPLALGVLFFLMFIGGCSSSTAGGIKVIRHVILFKQSGNELKKILYPRGVFSIQLNGQSGQKNIIFSVVSFVFLYFTIVFIASFSVSFSGMDIFSSFNLGLLMTGNIGLGIFNGSMEAAIYNLPALSKWVLSFAMIIGRLELLTVFAIVGILFNRHL